MRYGFENEWLVNDCFFQKWQIRIVSSERRPSMSTVHLDGDPLLSLVYFTFDDSRALRDETASDLLSIYDALTGSRLSEILPRPTNDPRRMLRGFRTELHRTLRAATDAGLLEIERHEVPWPFAEIEKAPASAPEAAQTSEELEYDEQVVFKDAQGIAIEGFLRYRITNLDDSQQWREGNRSLRGESDRFPTSAAQRLERALRYSKFKFDE